MKAVMIRIARSYSLQSASSILAGSATQDNTSFTTDFEGAPYKSPYTPHSPAEPVFADLPLRLAKWRIIISQEAIWRLRRSPRC